MNGKRQKMDPTTQDAQDETEMIIFDVVGNLLKNTNTSPAEVPVLQHSCCCLLGRKQQRAMLLSWQQTSFFKETLVANLVGSSGLVVRVMC